MNEEERFNVFTDLLLQRPLPDINNPIAHIRTLAKELAEGASRQFWPLFIEFRRGELNNESRTIIYDNKKEFQSRNISLYLYRRWNKLYPELELLEVNGYIDFRETGFRINKSAFDLLEEVEPSTIFISYRRRDSSAFALLVVR